jgi:hypothetical protein
MTIGPVERRQQALDALDKASRRAEKLFATVDPALFDGYQTAHDVLANLVFWQCEHINVVRALLDERQPELKEGTFAALNAEACACQRAESMTALLGCFQTQRAELAGLLNQVADWRMDYPIKQGGRPASVEDRVFALASNIENHLATLRRAALGKTEIWNEMS